MLVNPPLLPPSGHRAMAAACLSQAALASSAARRFLLEEAARNHWLRSGLPLPATAPTTTVSHEIRRFRYCSHADLRATG